MTALSAIHLRRPSFMTIAWALLIALCAWPLLKWGVIDAVFAPDAEACRAARDSGACWGVIVAKHRLLLFGRYPFAEQWRPFLASLLIVAMLVYSARPERWRTALLAAWVAATAAVIILMHGGLFGLSIVATRVWGGLPLTLIVSLSSTLLALPLALLLALGRRSRLPLLRSLCVCYIELVRGVPLISLLFMASFLFPLLLPEAWRIDMLPRAIAALGLFAAAYLAEVIRGGLQAVPATQLVAARALGMTHWQALRLVVLPQALRAALPALAGSFVGIFKDSSLISIVSLQELTGSLSLALGGDPEWRPFYLEGYLFVALVYWVFCFGLSRQTRRFELREVGRAAGKP